MGMHSYVRHLVGDVCGWGCWDACLFVCLFVFVARFI